MAGAGAVSEDDFRRALIAAAEGLGWHVTHLESHQTSAGVPDLNLCKGLVDMWLELKVEKPKGITLRPTQKKWHRDRARVRGVSWVVVLMNDGGILVVPGERASRLGTAAENWRAASNMVGTLGDLPRLIRYIELES